MQGPFSREGCEEIFNLTSKYKKSELPRILLYSLDNLSFSLKNKRTPPYVKLADAYSLATIFSEVADHGMWTYGLKGNSADLANALRYYKYAANHGSSKAAFNLGVIYLNQENLAQKGRSHFDASRKTDIEKALFWLRKASYMGSFGAAGTLADLYAKGIGVLKDPVSAYAWQAISVALETLNIDRDRVPSMYHLLAVVGHGKNINSLMIAGNQKVLSKMYNQLTNSQKNQGIILSKKNWSEIRFNRALDNKLSILNKSISMPYIALSASQVAMAGCAMSGK